MSKQKTNYYINILSGCANFLDKVKKHVIQICATMWTKGLQIFEITRSGRKVFYPIAMIGNELWWIELWQCIIEIFALVEYQQNVPKNFKGI